MISSSSSGRDGSTPPVSSIQADRYVGSATEVGTKVLPAPTLPASQEDLTPEWLTAVLRAGGFLGEGRVVACEGEALGAGEGFVGQIVRLRLSFDRPSPEAPASVIAKLPIRLAKNRQAGEAIGAYEREINFYTELSDRVPIPKPACYYAAMDPNPFAGRERGSIRLFERLPRWLIRILVPFGMWVAARSRRRYVLLLEDMAPRRLGNQVAGCSRGEAEAALRHIAKVHAAFWEHDDLERVTWLLPANSLSRYVEVLYRRSHAAFATGFGAGLSPEFAAFVESLARDGESIMRRLGDPPATLLHGDFRLDNLFFEGEGRDARVTAFDWQTACQGPAALDVAYFISGNLTPEVAQASERGLLEDYYETLVAEGVTGYELEDLVRD